MMTSSGVINKSNSLTDINNIEEERIFYWIIWVKIYQICLYFIEFTKQMQPTSQQ